MPSFTVVCFFSSPISMITMGSMFSPTSCLASVMVMAICGGQGQHTYFPAHVKGMYRLSPPAYLVVLGFHLLFMNSGHQLCPVSTTKYFIRHLWLDLQLGCMLQRVFVTKLPLFLAGSFVRLDFTSIQAPSDGHVWLQGLRPVIRWQLHYELNRCSCPWARAMHMENKTAPSSPVGSWVQALLYLCLSLPHARYNSSFHAEQCQLVFYFFLLLFIRHENRMAHFLSSSSGRIQHNNSLNTIRFQIWIYMTSHLDLSVFHVFGSREMFCICTAQNNYLPSMQMISPIDPIKLDSFPPPLEKQLHKTPDYRVWWPICLIFISSRVQAL